MVKIRENPMKTHLKPPPSLLNGLLNPYGIVLVTFSDDEVQGWTLAHRNETHRSWKGSMVHHSQVRWARIPGGNGFAWRYFTLLTKVITPFITGSGAHLAGFLRPKFVHGSVHYQRPAFQHAAESFCESCFAQKKIVWDIWDEAGAGNVTSFTSRINGERENLTYVEWYWEVLRHGLR